MNRTAIIFACLLSLSACDARPATSGQNAEGLPSEPVEAAPDVDPIEVEKAIKELESWDAVIEVLHDESLAVQWVIGVKDDGSKRYGLAESVCMELDDRGLKRSQTWVRIVDRQSVMANGGDFRAASLGSVKCATGERIDP